MPNLEKSYALVKGFPFAYRQGVVENININATPGYDHIIIKVNEEDNNYIVVGANWGSGLDTELNGDFYRVLSDGLPPVNDYSGPHSITKTPIDAWIPTTPTEAVEHITLPPGNVGLHLNGVPFDLISDKK